MTDRTSLPAELRRLVLVEAGHRCAIHTCRHIDVDVHHIIPWEQCREHAYENLIALCPNCHRRADSGEIDRKALRMYKARLVAGVVAPEAPALVSTQVERPGDSEWRRLRVAETRDEPVRYEVEIEIPAFAPTDLQELNELERAWALTHVQSFRRLRFLNSAVAAGGSRPSGPEHYLSCAFEMFHYSVGLVSFRYALSEYHVGAAHGQHSVRSITAQRNPFVVLEFDDLFDDSSAYGARVSQFAIEQLLRSGISDPEWVRDGAGPDSANFSHSNISDGGLLLTFAEYQVASYAAGPQHVTVPWALLRDVLNPRCGLLVGAV